MDEAKIQQASIEDGREPLPELPFTFQRVYNPKDADYSLWRVDRVRSSDQENKPKTDETIVEEVRAKHKVKEWFTEHYWRDKGLPAEQIEFDINGFAVTIYNFNAEKPFSDEHLAQATRVFQDLTARFPDFLNKIRYVLLDDVQPESLSGDNDLYPTNGITMREYRAIKLMPRAMETFPHRIPSASNFEGTLLHELGHLIQPELEEAWKEKFQWAYCSDHEDEWELREVAKGKKRWFNRTTGIMSPTSQYPLQPSQCVTDYARGNIAEDICDSIVAYFFKPKRLRDLAPEKYAILESLDRKQDVTVEVSTRRVNKEEISLPEIKPETIRYFINEPEE